MLTELEVLLSQGANHATKADYRYAIIEDNVLGKRTTSTRRLTAQRLSELYALDAAVPIFRALRMLWSLDPPARPLLAILCATARDPLLRMTAPPVLEARVGELVEKSELIEILSSAAPDRFNASILDKIARNALSSWTQSGHLKGRRQKIRIHPSASPAAVCYSLLLGYVSGKHGEIMLQTLWTRMLDASLDRLYELAAEASRRGLMDFKRVGNVIESRFPSFVTAEEEKLIRGQD